jgi:hypothetical protein
MFGQRAMTVILKFEKLVRLNVKIIIICPKIHQKIIDRYGRQINENLF